MFVRSIGCGTWASVIVVTGLVASAARGIFPSPGIKLHIPCVGRRWILNPGPPQSCSGVCAITRSQFHILIGY